MKIRNILFIFALLNIIKLNQQTLLFFFLGLVIFNYLFTTLLNYINDKNWKDNIPENLKDFYNQKNIS